VSPILVRTFSGLIYILIILGSVLLGPVAFGFSFLAFLVLCKTEYVRIFANAGISINKFTFILIGTLTYILVVLNFWGYIGRDWLFLLLPLVYLIYIIELFRNKTNPVLNLNFSLGGLIYLTLPFILLNVFFYPDFNFNEYSIGLLFGFFIVIWTNDTFAYLSGMFFGRHKFFERISPRKTWEGTIGGLLFGVVSGLVLSIFFTQYNALQWAGYAFTIIIFGTFGDLFESMVKRTLGIKDSGNIMPGHGGILDRFDSVLLAAPFAFYYIVIVLN
jgi:phosphatidate cytidylyltransferase